MSPDRPPVAFVPLSARPKAAIALGCHGNPDRCLTIGHHRMPVCARCAGLVAGNAAAAGLAVVAQLPSVALALALLAPLVIDGALQATTSYRSTSARRLATGLAGGVGQFSIAMAAIVAVLRMV